MTRLAYDSTNAADIPQDAEIVCGYADGRYKWSDADWALFPNAVEVRIAVFEATDDGEVGDVEDGCMTPAGGAAWVHMRRAAGADPTLYVNRANWQATRDALAAIGEPAPHWWLASYDNDPTIPVGCVAKQYANEPLTGGHYDLSAVADYWPGVDHMDQLVTRAELEAYQANVKETIEEMKAVETRAIEALRAIRDALKDI